MVSSLDVPSSLGGFEDKKLQEVDMRLMWTGVALVLFAIGYTIGSPPHEAKIQEKSKREYLPVKFVRIWTLLCSIRNKGFHLYHSPRHLRHVPVLEMAHSSNVIIHGGIFNSAQGDFHINNKDSGMYVLRSVQKSIQVLIDDPIKDFVT